MAFLFNNRFVTMWIWIIALGRGTKELKIERTSIGFIWELLPLWYLIQEYA